VAVIRPPRVEFATAVKRPDGTTVYMVTREWYRFFLDLNVALNITTELELLVESGSGVGDSSGTSIELSKQIASIVTDFYPTESARIAQLERRIASLEVNV